jgi:O-antigen/teichoic acid export membrane protein
MKKGLTNAGIRGFSLAARLMLAAYLAKYFSLTEVGLYGIMYSITAAMPAIIGFGFNHSLNREIATEDKTKAAQKIKNRIAVSIALALISTPAIGLILHLNRDIDTKIILLFLAILIAEVASTDLHYSLIALGKAVEANILLFLRSSIWIYPLIGAGLISEDLRTLEFILQCWIAGHATSATFFIIKYRSKITAKVLRHPLDSQWYIQQLRKNRLIYLSELGIVGTMFADRFIITATAGLDAAGVFILFWTLANAVQLLVASSISQIALPKMMHAHKNGGIKELLPIVRRSSIQAALVGTLVAISMFTATCIALPYTNNRELQSNIDIFIVLLVFSTIKSVSDIWNLGLYSAGKDNSWALINISSAIATISLGIPASLFLGGIGMAITHTLVATASSIARWSQLKR